jgi:hypothetical protein
MSANFNSIGEIMAAMCFGIDILGEREQLAAPMRHEKGVGRYSRDRDIGAWAVAIDRYRVKALHDAKVKARLARRPFVRSEFEARFNSMLAERAEGNRIFSAAVYGDVGQRKKKAAPPKLQLVYSRD